MSTYRISRNIEATLVDYVSTQLTADGWAGIRTEKSFKHAYKGTLPCICINIERIDSIRKEIGSLSHINVYLVNFRIFATSDGQRLDLADWLFEKLETTINYYTYNIISGTVDTKTLAGKINVGRIRNNKKEFLNIENLEVEDKFRHIISAEITVN